MAACGAPQQWQHVEHRSNCSMWSNAVCSPSAAPAPRQRRPPGPRYGRAGKEERRDRQAGAPRLYRSSTSRPRPRPQPYYSRVIDREPVEKPPSSNFQLLRQELFGAPSNPKPEAEQSSPVYGTVHRFAPNDKSTSQLDRVRSLLAQEEGNEVNEQSKNAFDRIRDRLLKSTRKKLHRTRNLRRKGSKKRRRNVSNLISVVFSFASSHWF